MEDLLPLLLGIIWLAYTWYSQNQKKKRQAQRMEEQEVAEEMASDQEPASANIQTLFEEMLLGKTSSAPITPYTEPETEYKTPEIATYEFLDQEDNGNEVNSPLSRELMKEQRKQYRSKPIQHINIMDIPDSEDNRRLHVDLRKAVIYDAILNRPYY